MKHTILITGGAGFIGSHIADAYIADGHRVVIVDNFSQGSRDNCNPKATVHDVDITDLDALRTIFKNEKPDIVSHHAARAAVSEALRDPTPTIETNVIGTTNVCIAAGEAGVSRLIFASTGGVMYGDDATLPVSEATPPSPTDPYGLSKQCSEKVVQFYARHYGFSSVIFRYGNVYGARQNPKGEAGVVAIFGGLMREKKTPTIFGDGTKTRDYVYVADIVSANVAALTHGDGETMNIGLGREVSDREVYDAVADVCGFTEKPKLTPFRDGEVRHSALDASKAKKVLGWKPEVQFEEGVRKTLGSLTQN